MSPVTAVGTASSASRARAGGTSGADGNGRVAEAPAPAEHTGARTRTRAPFDGPTDQPPGPLGVVPRPRADETVVALRAVAGGLDARQAEWGVDGGQVLLVGEAPFVDVTGRAGFRSDGTLDGTVAMRAAVRVLGLEVAAAEWSVAGWTPAAALPVPAVQLRGTTVAVDLAPVAADVALTTTEGLAGERTATGATIRLPDDAAPPGVPLEPRVVELFRTLRDWDVSALRAHPGSPVEQAPAFVSDTDLFFAPGRYGPDSRESAALLDAAVRAALRGLVGPVEPTPPAPPPQPAPDAGEVPAPEVTPVPATVPELPPVAPAAQEAAAEEPAAPLPGATGGEPEGAPGADVEAAAEEGASEAGGAAPEEAAPGAEGEAPAVEVELIMPEAPAEPGPAAQARAGAVSGGAGGAARAAKALPPAEDTVADARGAVTEPVAETAARAREDLAAALGERPAPSPEIVELCERIRTAIREKRPVDEDELLETDPTHEAQSAGATISGSVEGQVGEVRAGYADLDNPPAGTPALTPDPVEAQDPSSRGMGVDAASAAPDPIPPENLSLDADVAATDERIAGSGIDTRVTQEIPSAPFATVRDERGALGEMAQQTPAELAAEQQAAIDTAQADMAALQARATQALRTARAGTVGDVAGGQGQTVKTEEQTRESVSAAAQAVFNEARSQVTTLLEPLSRTAMARWTAGLAQASQTFHDALDAVQDWIDERHSGVGGFVVGLGDAVFGLPGWVIREYDRAERQFGDDVCALLLDISTDVNGVVAAAQAIIATAREDIDGKFAAMEAEFPEFAARERARFAGMLDGLSQQVTETQTSFVRDVSQAATTAVTDAQAAVEERREAARGVIGRIAAAIEAFIDDPVTAIINGLLSVLGIPPAAFWGLVARIQQVIGDIADDPENFINNLTAGVKQGFQQFFDNFGTHVLKGFWAWLFSGLEVPIPMPTDFSPGSLFSFALQLMGITWPRVREILVRHVGAQNVEIIEAAWQLISVLIEKGPSGLVDMIKEQLTPEVIVQTILEAAVEYLVETLIQQVIVRVIGMLNPVGAVLQAIDLIYQVCSWIFRNAARIFRFVEAVVNGMADVIAGNIGGLAAKVEQALASLIPPVIDFLAGLLHLGDLPNQVADVIMRLQARVYAVMDLVIGTLAERGRALLRSLGIGGEEEDEEGGENEDEELGTTVRFSAAGESHRVFFQTAGDEATLMVASVPQPIEDKIAEWRGMLAAGTPSGEAERAEATPLLGNLESVANEADAEGDRLAALFLQAAADQGDEVEPPSDDALENRQRAIAGMLDRLYTLFGQQDEAAIVRDIADNLPGHGEARAASITASWERRVAEERYLPADAEADQPLWDTAAVATAATAAGIAVLRQPATHLALVQFFTGPTQRRGGAASQTFADYALVNRSAPHSVRTQFQSALGNAYADALRSQVPADLDPIDTALATQIGSIGYDAATLPYGAISNLPSRATGADPPLVTAVGGATGVIPFLRAMAQARVANGYRWPRFVWAWGQRPSHDYVATAFRNAPDARGVSGGKHEWIPTSEIRNVVEYAIQQAALNPGDISRSVGWIDFFHALRSQTADVAYYIRSGPTLPTDPRPARTPVTDVGIGSHSGAQAADEAGQYTRGTIGQGPFHDWLREVWYATRDSGPVAFGQSLISRLGYELWDGTLTEAMAPRAVWFTPIDVYFTIDGEGTRIRGLTLAQLAMRQREAWQRIQSDFTRALYSVDV